MTRSPTPPKRADRRQRRADPSLERGRRTGVGRAPGHPRSPDRRLRREGARRRAIQGGRERARRRLWHRPDHGRHRAPRGARAAASSDSTSRGRCSARRAAARLPREPCRSTSAKATLRWRRSSAAPSTSCSRASASCSSPTRWPPSRTSTAPCGRPGGSRSCAGSRCRATRGWPVRCRRSPPCCRCPRLLRRALPVPSRWAIRIE